MMDGKRISIRREGPVIVLEDIEDTKDYKGVLKATYLDAETAIRIGLGMVNFGLQIKHESREPGKVLPLAVPYDPHPEDR